MCNKAVEGMEDTQSCELCGNFHSMGQCEKIPVVNITEVCEYCSEQHNVSQCYKVGKVMDIEFHSVEEEKGPAAGPSKR